MTHSVFLNQLIKSHSSSEKAGTELVTDKELVTDMEKETEQRRLGLPYGFKFNSNTRSLKIRNVD